MPRPRGRPRNFDETEAVQKAMRLFWTKGFDAVTVDDLVASMGVGRPTLYAVFGDKAVLFMRCLHAYAEWLGGGALKALLGPARVAEGVNGLLAHVVKSATLSDSPWGCLMICVAPAVDDPAVRKFLAKARTETATLVEQRLRRAVAEGELPSDFPCAVRARLIVDMSAGLVIRARLTTPRAELLKDASQPR